MKFDYDELSLSQEIDDEAEEKCRHIIRMRSTLSGNVYRVLSSKKRWLESNQMSLISITKI